MSGGGYVVIEVEQVPVPVIAHISASSRGSLDRATERFCAKRPSAGMSAYGGRTEADFGTPRSVVDRLC